MRFSTVSLSQAATPTSAPGRGGGAGYQTRGGHGQEPANLRQLILTEKGLPFYEVRQEVTELWSETDGKIRELLDEDQIPYYEEMMERIPMGPRLPPPPFGPP